MSPSANGSGGRFGDRVIVALRMFLEHEIEAVPILGMMAAAIVVVSISCSVGTVCLRKACLRSGGTPAECSRMDSRPYVEPPGVP